MSLVDFFGHSVVGSFSDAACKQGFKLRLGTQSIHTLSYAVSVL